jgi:hypothetical protein
MSKSLIVGLIIYFIASAFSLARADQPKLVIVDNDFTGPPDTLDDLRSALMFLDNPNVKILGFTVVTGNGWRNEEVAHSTSPGGNCFALRRAGYPRSSNTSP